MRTTLDIRDSLLVKAKALAALERITLTQLIEEGLALRLRPVQQRHSMRSVCLPVYHGRSGLAPRIDALSNWALFDAMEDESGSNGADGA